MIPLFPSTRPSPALLVMDVPNFRTTWMLKAVGARHHNSTTTSSDWTLLNKIEHVPWEQDCFFWPEFAYLTPMAGGCHPKSMQSAALLPWSTQGLSFKEESKVAADSVVQNPNPNRDQFLVDSYPYSTPVDAHHRCRSHIWTCCFLVIDHYGNRSCYTTHDAHTHKPCKTQHMCIICVCITVYIRYKYTTYMHTCIPCTPCMYTNMYMSTIYMYREILLCNVWSAAT